jgi:hypothetical protein
VNPRPPLRPRLPRSVTMIGLDVSGRRTAVPTTPPFRGRRSTWPTPRRPVSRPARASRPPDRPGWPLAVLPPVVGAITRVPPARRPPPAGVTRPSVGPRRLPATALSRPCEDGGAPPLAVAGDALRGARRPLSAVSVRGCRRGTARRDDPPFRSPPCCAAGARRCGDRRGAVARAGADRCGARCVWVVPGLRRRARWASPASVGADQASRSRRLEKTMVIRLMTNSLSLRCRLVRTKTKSKVGANLSSQKAPAKLDETLACPGPLSP